MPTTAASEADGSEEREAEPADGVSVKNEEAEDTGQALLSGVEEPTALTLAKWLVSALPLTVALGVYVGEAVKEGKEEPDRIGVVLSKDVGEPVGAATVPDCTGECEGGIEPVAAPFPLTVGLTETDAAALGTALLDAEGEEVPLPMMLLEKSTDGEPLLECEESALGESLNVTVARALPPLLPLPTALLLLVPPPPGLPLDEALLLLQTVAAFVGVACPVPAADAVSIGVADAEELGVGMEGTGVAEEEPVAAPWLTVAASDGDTEPVGVAGALCVAPPLLIVGGVVVLGTAAVALFKTEAALEAQPLGVLPLLALVSALLLLVTEALPLAAAEGESEGEGESDSTGDALRVTPSERDWDMLPSAHTVGVVEGCCEGDVEVHGVGEVESASLREAARVCDGKPLPVAPYPLALAAREGRLEEVTVANEEEGVPEGKPEAVDAGDGVTNALREGASVAAPLCVAPKVTEAAAD